MSLLTDELRGWVGREAIYTAPEELGRAALRYFALAVGDDNPVYTDDQAARAAGYDGVVAPPTLVCESNQYMDRPRDADGYMGHTWDLPVTNCRQLRGGHEYAFGQPVVPSDVLTARWRIAELYEKRDLLFVVSEVVYTNQHGAHLATNRETTIYQQL